MALPSAKPRYEQNGLTVPYITSWSSEQMTMPAVRVSADKYGAQLAFQDENPMDRDQHGVIWVRQGLGRGRGRAHFPLVHAYRQRRAMFDLLCQVCGGSTLDESFNRQLYVMNSADGSPIDEGELTTAPPVCTGCAPEAVVSCPRLADKFVAAWVESAYSWGVAGILYDPRTLQPVTGEVIRVPFTDVRVRWMIATRSVSALCGVTAVNLAGLTMASCSAKLRAMVTSAV
ncbi:hypothetical protein [Streptomyces hundungensis]|uniref:hypothetical protein n=1 Tax=Streptomyces hundungensis TaxID=1077946 RepID=UPI0031E9D8A4